MYCQSMIISLTGYIRIYQTILSLFDLLNTIIRTVYECDTFSSVLYCYTLQDRWLLNIRFVCRLNNLQTNIMYNPMDLFQVEEDSRGSLSYAQSFLYNSFHVINIFSFRLYDEYLLFIHDWSLTSISQRLSKNSEAFASEFLENLGDMFPSYW